MPGSIFFEGGKMKLILDKAITGISDGQAVVLYEKEKVLGGGTIWS